MQTAAANIEREKAATAKRTAVSRETRTRKAAVIVTIDEVAREQIPDWSGANMSTFETHTSWPTCTR
jgi:hypothetical protein